MLTFEKLRPPIEKLRNLHGCGPLPEGVADTDTLALVVAWDAARLSTASGHELGSKTGQLRSPNAPSFDSPIPEEEMEAARKEWSRK